MISSEPLLKDKPMKEKNQFEINIQIHHCRSFKNGRHALPPPRGFRDDADPALLARTSFAAHGSRYAKRDF